MVAKKAVSLVFKDGSDRFYLHMCFGEKFFDALSIWCIPAADRLTIFFVDVCFFHAEIASSGSTNDFLS
jgi:hypothetical protein